MLNFGLTQKLPDALRIDRVDGDIEMNPTAA